MVARLSDKGKAAARRPYVTPRLFPNPEDLSLLAAFAEGINAAHEDGRQSARKRLLRYHSAGCGLLSAKEILGRIHGGSCHGHWLEWLRQNIRFSEWEARRYMRFFRLVKSVTVTDLEVLEEAWRAACGRAGGDEADDEPSDDEPAADEPRGGRGRPRPPGRPPERTPAQRSYERSRTVALHEAAAGQAGVHRAAREILKEVAEMLEAVDTMSLAEVRKRAADLLQDVDHWQQRLSRLDRDIEACVNRCKPYRPWGWQP
jgi:hypothetical protein